MEQGQRVCYTEAHWKWLKDAGLIPQRSVSREFFCGTVVAAEGDACLVKWDAGRHTPRPQTKPSRGSHLIVNLETV